MRSLGFDAADDAEFADMRCNTEKDAEDSQVRELTSGIFAICWPCRIRVGVSELYGSKR